jgi:prephenate dehydrogenase
VTASSEAIHLASDLVRLVEATPFFVDAAEHDGLMAGVEHLPAALSLALLQAAADGASWREMRKLAGPAFENATRILSGDPATLRDTLLLNRDNVLRLVDDAVAALHRLREMIDAQDAEALGQATAAASEIHRAWLRDRSAGLWEKPVGPEIPTGGGFLGRMFGLRGDRDWRRGPSAD